MVDPIYEVDPGGVFAKSVQEAAKLVDDLRPAFFTIAKSWFRSNRAIFTLKSPGKYADLSPNYKNQKKKKHGFVYPILKAQGLLEKSLVQEGDQNSIVNISKTDMTLGTSVPYSPYLHFGTKFMPARPVIIIGAEQAGFTGELNQRQELWMKTIGDYVFEVTGQKTGGA